MDREGLESTGEVIVDAVGRVRSLDRRAGLTSLGRPATYAHIGY